MRELPDNIFFSHIEKLIIQKRLCGLSFCQLSEDFAKTEIDRLIIKASTITGCKLPATDFFANALTEEIKNFFEEFNYSKLTMEEIIFSIRVNANGGLKFSSGNDIEQVMFTGHYFNIDYLSKVLYNYRLVRNALDRKLENFLSGHK